MPDRKVSLLPTVEGLARILKPEQWNPSHCIVVAGTNGKGSVCATLETLLLSAGKTVGTYTSPHLETITERIRVNGKNISKKLFAQTYSMIADHTLDLKLSHFEALTLMAAYTFFSGKFKTPPEYTLFEVGMGGTWDATNAIPHDYCIITSLALDHESILGSTLEEIAPNKWGIISKENEVIYSPLPPELEEAAREKQIQTKTSWIPGTAFETFQKKSSRTVSQTFIRCKWGEAPLALTGRRGGMNTATALTAFHALGFDPASHLHALVKVNWPGRMERIVDRYSPCPIYLSGDHNPAGIESLIDLLTAYERGHLHIIVGVTRGKALKKIINPLLTLPESSLYFTESPFRGLTIDEVSEWNSCFKLKIADPVQLMEEVIQAAKKGDLILVTGSLYLVGLYRSIFRKRKSKKG